MTKHTGAIKSRFGQVSLQECRPRQWLDPGPWVWAGIQEKVSLNIYSFSGGQQQILDSGGGEEDLTPAVDRNGLRKGSRIVPGIWNFPCFTKTKTLVFLEKCSIGLDTGTLSATDPSGGRGGTPFNVFFFFTAFFVCLFFYGRDPG